MTRRTFIAAIGALAGSLLAIPSLFKRRKKSGPAVHYRADIGVVRDSEGRVTQWRDLSGNGHDLHLQPDGNFASADGKSFMSREVIPMELIAWDRTFTNTEVEAIESEMMSRSFHG